jgi:hypothetical protein
MTIRRLIRESDYCYREPDPEEGKRGLAFFRYALTMSATVPQIQRFASNLPDTQPDWDLRETFEYNRAIEKGEAPPPARVREAATDAGRVRYALEGPLKMENQRFGCISEDGTTDSRDPVYLSVYAGHREHGRDMIIWLAGNEYVEKGFHVSVHLSGERMQWLLDQLDRRPTATLSVHLDFKAFQREVDYRFRESDTSQTVYFEKKHHELTGVSFFVSDPRLSEMNDEETKL